MPPRTKIAIFVVIIIALIVPVFSYSQELLMERPIKYVRGRIRKIDFAGSKLSVEWFYSTDKNISEDTMTFFLPDNVQVFTDKRRIFQAVRPAGVVDLIEGDKVIIKYYDDKKKEEKDVISIRVMEHDTPIPP